MLPSSPMHEPDARVMPPLSLSTYTAGEDAGRLAMMAKEFGLARRRSAKPQLRKHAFTAFLRNNQSNLSLYQQSTDDSEEIECIANDILQSYESSYASERHPPLRFLFSGYSLWLELEQRDIDAGGLGDLDRVMIDAADEFSLGGAIPSPHVTALYGINTIEEEDEMRRVFRENVKAVLSKESEKRASSDGKLWPDLEATGIIVGAEFDGVNGGSMDMAWAEVSLATSPEHEALINALHELFYHRSSSSSPFNEEKKEEYAPRSNSWMPHLSLCYDNPDGFGPNLSRAGIEAFMREKCPTLENVLDNTGSGIKFERAVSGISLWRTAGRMDEWKCLDRFEFPSVA